MNDDEIIQTLAQQLASGERASATLADGREVTVTSEPDDSGDSPFDRDDCMGSIHWPSRFDEGRRPDGCDGSARKFDTRSGPVWWMPSGMLADESQEIIAQVAERVRAYFREDWSYVGIVVKVRELPCDCCGHRRENVSSLWGIESDADDYFAEVIGDLLLEASVS